MESTADSAFSSNISLLETRLLRVEHLLFGTSFPSDWQDNAAADQIETLERRLYALLSRIKVYGDFIRLYKANPSLFLPPTHSEPPIDLSPEAIRATVIASAASFPATASALTSVSDCPIPEASQSAALAALGPKMKGIEATQRAQLAEMAELRARSEAVIQAWYEDGVLGTSRFVADVEGRLSKIDRCVRRAEKERETAESY